MPADERIILVAAFAAAVGVAVGLALGLAIAYARMRGLVRRWSAQYGQQLQREMEASLDVTRGFYLAASAAATLTLAALACRRGAEAEPDKRPGRPGQGGES